MTRTKPRVFGCALAMVRQRVLERTVSLRISEWYRRYLLRDGESRLREAAMLQLNKYASAAGARRKTSTENEVRMLVDSSKQFVQEMPKVFFHQSQRVRRLAFRRCVDRIRLDVRRRKVTIWVRRLPILGATAGGLVKIHASLPKERARVALGPRKRRYKSHLQYDLNWHLARRPTAIRELALKARQMILGIGSDIEEEFHQQYIAYSIAKHFVCLRLRREYLQLYPKLDPASVRKPPPFFRDVSNIGTALTGRVELTIRSVDDLHAAMPLLQRAHAMVRKYKIMSYAPRANT